MKKLISAFFDKRFLKFCLVGAANTLVGAGVMFLLYNVAYCSYTFSSAMNYVVGSVLSYFLNKHFTFEVREYSASQVLRFIVNIAVCYAVASASSPLRKKARKMGTSPLTKLTKADKLLWRSKDSRLR